LSRTINMISAIVIPIGIGGVSNVLSCGVSVIPVWTVTIAIFRVTNALGGGVVISVSERCRTNKNAY
jgi:hypothetical protein